MRGSGWCEVTTITAVPNPTTGAVVVTVTPTAEVTAVLRTDNAGVTAVRTLDGALPTTAPVVIEDYEAPLDRPATWSVVGGPAAQATATLPSPDGGAWLTVAAAPQWSWKPAMVEDLSWSAEAGAVLHDVIDRPDPLLVTKPLRSRAGSLRVWCASAEEADAIADVYRRGQVVLARIGDTAPTSLYHVATTVRATLDPATVAAPSPRWHVDIDYRQLRRPDGPLLGTLGWSWNDLAADYGSWTEVAAAYESWVAVQTGPTP